MKKFTQQLLLFVCLIYCLDSKSITRVSAASGDWNSAATWNPLGVPSCGDSLVIQATHSVNISNQLNYTGCAIPFKIMVCGNVKFFNGSKLRLCCGSYIYVATGGKISADVGLSNSNLIEICGNVEWNSNSELNGPACIAPSHPFCANILPVELSDFKADKCNDRVCLSWTTLSESNNEHFVIERSADALNFKPVLKVPSKAPGGNSKVKLVYSAKDSRNEALVYYRLKQVDLDQTTAYSNIVSVSPGPGSDLQISVFPNANSGEFTTEVRGLQQTETVTVLLRDQAGVVIYKTVQQVDEISTQFHVAAGVKLPNGFYFCSFLIGNKEQVIKIVVTES